MRAQPADVARFIDKLQETEALVAGAIVRWRKVDRIAKVENDRPLTCDRSLQEGRADARRLLKDEDGIIIAHAAKKRDPTQEAAHHP